MIKGSEYSTSWKKSMRLVLSRAGKLALGMNAISKRLYASGNPVDISLETSS